MTEVPRDWSTSRAPSLVDFENLAEQAYASLPKPFRDRCHGLLIRIEDFPDEDALDALGLESEFDLLGLYQGVSIAAGPSAIRTAPDSVLLYRRPILDYWADGEESLGHLITHVLVHEIGHHIGLSDAEMEAIEAQTID